jgi:hypothetical protein
MASERTQRTQERGREHARTIDGQIWRQTRLGSIDRKDGSGRSEAERERTGRIKSKRSEQ